MAKTTHYNLLKVVTTILVVFAHSSRMYTGEGVVTPSHTSSVLSLLTEVIYTFHMPLFIAISGMIYGLCVDDLNKYDNTWAFLKNKVFRLLIPYFFCGLLYVAPVMCGFGFTETSYFHYCLKGIILTDDPRHLWYLIVLFEIYLLCAILKRFIQKTPFYIVFLPLLAIAVFSEFVPNRFYLSTLLYYIFFFYLGYVFNKHYEKVIGILKHPAVMCALALGASCAFCFRQIRVIKITTAILACCLVIAATCYLPAGITKNRAFQLLNQNGFGIYLFHPMIIYILYYYLCGYDIPPAVLCIGIAVTAYCLSLLMTVIIRKLRLGFLIGEKRCRND